MCKRTKRILSMVMSLVMVMSMFSGVNLEAFAEELQVIKDTVFASGARSGDFLPIKTITVEKLTIAEYTNGYWNRFDNGEELSDWYYHYNLYFPDFTVTFYDGTVTTSVDGAVEYDGRSVWLDVDYFFFQHKTPLKVGSNEVPVHIDDVYTTAIVEIVPSDVKSIEVEPLSIIENTEGYWSSRYDYDSDEELYYFNYYPTVKNYTVTMNDGTVLTPDIDGRIEYNGEYYRPSIEDTQYNYPFEVGTNVVPVSILGSATMATIEILETPVVSAEINPIQIIKNSGGRWAERYEYSDDGESDGELVRYYVYDIEYNGFTLTLKDGTVLSTDRGHVDYNNEQYWPVEIVEQDEKPLVTGVNQVEVSILGYKTTVEVEILENPVADATFEPVKMIKEVNGSWSIRYNEETQEEESFFYYYLNFSDFTLTMKDGTQLVSEDGVVEFNGDLYPVRINQDQYEKPLTAGIHEIPVSIIGYETTVTVEIAETPVASIDFEPLTVIENTNGSFVSYDYETYEHMDTFFLYRLPELKYTINFKDGSKITAQDGFEYDGSWYLLDVQRAQYKNHLSIGENEVTGSVLGYNATFPVTVVESPVASVDAKPVNKRENVDGEMRYDYDEETGIEKEVFYYYINIPEYDYVVTLKDGTVLTSQEGCVVYNGATYYMEYQYSDSALELGENVLDCCILGYNVPVTFIVSENPSLGDLDGDGYTTSSDARLALRISVALEQVSDDVMKNADVNADGNISAADARMILRVSSKLENGDNFAAVRIINNNYYDRSEVTGIFLEPEHYQTGNEFTVDVIASNAAGLQNANVFMTYDTDALEFVKIESALTDSENMVAVGKYDDGKISLGVLFRDAATEDYFKIATITFKALTDSMNHLYLDIAEWCGTDVPYSSSYILHADIDIPNVEETTTEPTTEAPTTEAPTTETTTKPTVQEPEYYLGDVSPDGRITAADARLALRIAAGLESDVTENQFKSADVNSDGKITAEDARRIIRVSVALEKFDNPNDPDYENAGKPVFAMTSSDSDDTVKVTLSAKNFAGTKSADMHIKFDPAKLEYAGNENSSASFISVCGQIDDETVALSLMFPNYAEKDENLITLTFKVLDRDNAGITVDVLSWTGTECPDNCSFVIGEDTTTEPSAETTTAEAPSTTKPAEPTTINPPETDGPLGDIDNDGYITAADARIIFRVAAKLEKADDFELCDLNGDGKITAADARLAMRYSALLDPVPEYVAPARTYLDEERYDDVILKADIQKYNVGDEFTITISAENMSGTQSGNLFLTYDDNVLEFVSATRSDGCNCDFVFAGAYEDMHVSIGFAYLKAATADEDIATITFRALKSDYLPIECAVGTWTGTPAPQDGYFTLSAEETTTAEVTTAEPETEPTTEAPVPETTTKEPETEVPTTGHKDFDYRIIDGTLVIFGIKDGADLSNLVIPDTLDGYPVTDLSMGSQEDSKQFGNEYYYQITIPSSVKYIAPCSVGYYYEWATGELLLVPGFKIIGVPGSYAEAYANENGITFEAVAEEPETEEPTTEPTTKEPETTTKVPETTTKAPETTTKAPETTTKEPVTVAPTQKPVSDKLESSKDTVKVDNSTKVSTVKTKSSVADVIDSVKNENISIVDKNGKALTSDALVGTGSVIQIKDNSGKVINSYTVCVPNDIDGNGKTTAADARLALRGSAKLDKVEGVYAQAADVINDGKVTAADARKILRISAGLEKV